MITSTNPYTQETTKTYQQMTWDHVESKIILAHESFQSRKKTSFTERKQLMNNLAKIMQEQFEDLAKLDTQEMGMLYKDAKGDVTKSASNIAYFAENAEKILAPKPFDQDGLT